MNKPIKIFFVFLSALMLFAACAPTTDPVDVQESPAQQNTQPEIIDDVMLSLADAAPAIPDGASVLQLGFNLALLKKLSEIENGNLFYSSMSINTALTMAYFGAQGETQEQIADVLGYNSMNIEQIAAYQKYLLETYEDSGDTTFTSANSLWIDDSILAKQSYIETMEDVFDSLVKNLDLQSATAPAELNAWIHDSTNGMLEKLFDEEDEAFAEYVLVLMNAIYFKGEWTSPFDPDKTFDKGFNGTSGTSIVEMMSSDETVMGDDGDGYKTVFLPYGEDGRFAMITVLPDDMDSFIDSLTEEGLREILSTFEEKQDPMLQLPKFELEEKVKLNDTLKALGIERAFTPQADFSIMSEEGLWIDEVLHKAKITVDEEGTEAAAVTSVGMTLNGMPMNRFEFIADKPFLFFIMDTENDLVLFTGKVLDLN